MTRFDSATPESAAWRDAVLTLEMLCEQAGVTVRTVRYYITEGLLPPPIGHGTNARYSGEHLDRLAVIASLKDRFLPLREIRRTLGTMEPEEIRSMAGTFRETAAPAEPRPQAPRMQAAPEVQARSAPDVADYIANLLHQPAAPAPLRRSAPPPTAAESPTPWVRVPISEDAELLIAADSYERHEEQIAALVTWAQRMLK